MLKNDFLDKLKAGKRTVGTFFGGGNASVAEAIGLAGIDYIIIDSEHGPFEPEGAMEIMRGAELGGTTCLVRVKDGSRAAVLKMLDIGAKSLIVPNMHSAEEIRKVVEYAKYFPQGNRGVARARGAGFGAGAAASQTLEEYFRDCNERTLVIPQCETRGCLEQIEEVCAIDGVAGIFIGPFDLSCALGAPAQFDTEEFKDALVRIRDAAHAAGKFCIMFTTVPEAAPGWFEKGYDSVTIGMEYNHIVSAFQKLAKTARGEAK